MRILHLVSYPLYSGPVPHVLALARGQQARGHTVFVAIDRLRGNFNGFEEAAAPHVPEALKPPLALELSTHSRPWTVLRDWQHLRRLRGTMDVMHAHFSHDHTLLAMMQPQGVVRVRTVHAARSLQPRLGQRWLAQRVDGWVVRCARHADTLVHAMGVDAWRVAHVPGTVDAAGLQVSPAARDAVRARLGIPPEAPLLGHVALMARRGQEELLEAVAHGHPNVHVLLVGRGEREPALHRLVRRLGLDQRVHFAGYVPMPGLAELYAAMDGAFLAQPGNDAASRAGLEAMAAGVPLLAVMEGALSELLNAGGGYGIPERSVAGIGEALAAWHTDISAGVRRSGQAYVQAQRRPDGEVQQVLGLYERFMK